MSKFDDFMSTVGSIADKAAKETVKMTDVGATKVKIKAEEARLCDRYETLGRLAEEYLRAADDLPSQITASFSEIDKVKARITELENELSDKKSKYEEKASEKSEG